MSYIYLVILTFTDFIFSYLSSVLLSLNSFLVFQPQYLVCLIWVLVLLYLLISVVVISALYCIFVCLLFVSFSLLLHIFSVLIVDLF